MSEIEDDKTDETEIEEPEGASAPDQVSQETAKAALDYLIGDLPDGLHWSRPQVARAVDVTERTVYRWVEGRKIQGQAIRKALVRVAAEERSKARADGAVP